MDEAALVQRLEGLSPPAVEAAGERAAAAARMRFGGPEAESGPRERVRRRRPAPRLALAVGLLAVLAAALTPPGQAAVGWVGEKVGIGQPGGQPTIEGTRKIWEQGTSSEGAPAYVLAAGPAVGDQRYELVTYEVGPEAARDFELDVFEPGAHNGSGTYAGSERLPGSAKLPLEEALPASGGLRATWSGNGEPGGAYRDVEGRVSEDVDAVRVEFNGKTVPIELVSIPRGVLSELGLERPFKFFIGFTADMGAGEFQISAEDAEGHQVAHESLEAEAMPMLTPTVAQRLAKEGSHHR